MKIKKFLPIFIIIILGFFLRFYNYADFPVYGESQDEMAWTWMGSSILQGRHPTSWSSTGASGYWYDETLNFGGTTYRIISPYLDNPTLFSLIPGSFALLKGYSQPRAVPITIVRFPMILLACLNIYLLYIASKKWFSQRTALFSATLYATIPTIVFSGRLVIAENLIITWMLLSWIILYELIKNKNQKHLWLLAVIGGLSGLTKVSGLVVLFANTYLLLKNKLNKEAVKVFITGLLIFSIYPLYGFIVDKNLFLDVMYRQSQHFKIGLSGLINLFIYPLLVRKTLIDGWMYLGLIVIFLFLFKPSKKNSHQILSTYSLLWLGFLLFATNEVAGNGWYKYPLFPIMTIYVSSILLTTKQYINSLIGTYLLVWLPTIRLIFISLEKNINPRPFIILAFLPLVLNLTKVRPVWKKRLYFTFIIILLASNIAASIYFTKEAYWIDSTHFFPVRSGE